MVHRRQLGAVIAGRLFVLDLGWRGCKFMSTFSSQLLRRGARLDSVRTTVVADAVDVHIIHDGLVVHVVHIGDVYVIDCTIVVKVAATPVSAVKTGARIAEAVVNASVKADRRPPEAWVPVIQTRRKAPVARCPK